MSVSKRYHVAPTRIGNSRGYRVDASFFQEHPDMGAGEFEAAYLGADVVLLRRRPDGRSLGEVTTGVTSGEIVDPVVAAYLAWTERAMQEQPHLLRALTHGEFASARALVDGVTVDIEHDRLPDDFELPDME